MKWPGRLKLDETKFGPREKGWAVLFAVVVVGMTGYRWGVKPRIEAADDARSAYAQTENELARLEAERPDVEARRAQVDALRSQVASAYQELETLEEGLLNRQDQDLLLEQLVAERKRYRLQINAVRPLKDEKDKEPDKAKEEAGFYQRLLVQIDVYAGFDDLVRYLDLLETQRPYQRIQGVKVKIEGQEMVRPRALLTLETFLADLPEKVAKRREEVFAVVEQIAQSEAKDPFLAREKPKEETAATGLELTGIFGDGASAAAMINGEPYQIGDVIQGKRIVAILGDRVVLEQGARRYVLYARREGE